MANLAGTTERCFHATPRFLFTVLLGRLLRHAEDSIMVWALLNQAQNAALNELLEGQQSDRIVAIIGGAMLDDSLRHAIEQRFRFEKGVNDKLFKVGGPLGNTAPKIDLGYQLYMFEKPARNTMHGLTEIRNLFAHRLDMTFDDKGEKMKQAAAKIVLHEGRTHYPTPYEDVDSVHELEPTATLRDKFIVNLKLCLIELLRDHYRHVAWSNALMPEPVRP
jgi:hypothetical protein